MDPERYGIIPTTSVAISTYMMQNMNFLIFGYLLSKYLNFYFYEPLRLFYSRMSYI